MGKAGKIGFTALIAVLLTACSVSPEPIEYGSDSCAFCKMSIVDQRFGSEIVTSKGKVYKFDAIECMVNMVKVGDIQAEDVKLYLVTHYTNPAKLTPAENSVFLQTGEIKSPMGANLSAFPDKESIQALVTGNDGALYKWSDLISSSKNILEQHLSVSK